MSQCQNCPNAGHHPFCTLGHHSRAFMESNSVSMEHPRGTILFREGDSCSAIFVLCSGKVKISATSREGRTMILKIATAGDVLGMSAALARGDYEVTAEAIEPCSTRVLHLRHLTAMLDRYGDASLAAAMSMAEDYRSAFDNARLIALPSSPAGRVARLILNWVHDAGKGAHAPVTMSLTHEELAEMTATTRETVTRTFSKFRRDKVISTHGIALTVLQPQVLEKLSAC